MEVNPILQKVIAIYHITKVIAFIICVAVSITSLLFYFLLSAIILVILLIIFWFAPKCIFQDLVVILVHYNTILVDFPVFVVACILYRQSVMYSYYYIETVDVMATIIALMTGILSLGSAIFAVMGIWKSA